MAKLASDAWVVTPTREDSIGNNSVIMSSLKLKDKNSVKSCSCGVKFSVVITKKHWCKACGDIFCGNCSKMKHLLQKSSGKKFRERICNLCEEQIDGGSHPMIEPYKEHDHFKPGLRYEMDQENDANVCNSASKLIAYDGADKKINLMSPKPINRSSNSFTFTNYLLSPSTIEKETKSIRDESADEAILSDESTALESTATTITANASICSAQSSVRFNESHSTETQKPMALEESQPPGSFNQLETPADVNDVDYECSLTAPGVASQITAKSTLLTDASICTMGSKPGEISASKARSYEVFVTNMEGRGTCTKSSLSCTPCDEKGGAGQENMEGSVISEDSNKSFSQKLLEVSTCEDSPNDRTSMFPPFENKTVNVNDSIHDVSQPSLVAGEAGEASLRGHDADNGASDKAKVSTDSSLLKGVMGCGGVFASTSEAVHAVEQSITSTQTENSVEFNSTEIVLDGVSGVETNMENMTKNEFSIQLDTKILSSAPSVDSTETLSLRKIGFILVAYVAALMAISIAMFALSPHSAHPSVAWNDSPISIQSATGTSGHLISVVPPKASARKNRSYHTVKFANALSLSSSPVQTLHSQNNMLAVQLVPEVTPMVGHASQRVNPAMHMTRNFLKAPFKLISVIVGEFRVLGSELASPGFAECIM